MSSIRVVQRGPRDLPPAQVALRLGRHRAARRFRRRVLMWWGASLVVAVMFGWLFWQLPVLLSAVLVGITILGVAIETAIVALVLLTMSRASVAAGSGWVGVRMLKRWRVLRQVVEPAGEQSGQGVGRFEDSSHETPPFSLPAPTR